MPTVFARSLLSIALLSTAALTVTACGDDDDDSDKGAKSADSRSLPIRVTKAGKDEFRVRAPKSVKAGVVRITLTTPPGKRTSHDAQLVRVAGNHTVDDVLKVLAREGGPTPRWMIAAGGVGLTKGGRSATVTQELKPGKYFILDTGEPEGDDVPSYAESGATAELRVRGPASTAKLPMAPATITTDDGADTYTITASGLTPGKNTVEFTNDGRELHHVIAFPYNKGTTLADVKRTFKEQEGGPSGPPPVDFEGGVGTAVLDRRTKQIAQLELKRGKYALVCFISDRKGGPSHAEKGMVAETTVR